MFAVDKSKLMILFIYYLNLKKKWRKEKESNPLIAKFSFLFLHKDCTIYLDYILFILVQCKMII